MNLQKDAMITKQALEQHMEGEDSSWRLESQTTTSKMESLSASTATSIDIWQRNSSQRKRNEKPGSVSNVIKKGILPRTAKESR